MGFKSGSTDLDDFVGRKEGMKKVQLTCGLKGMELPKGRKKKKRRSGWMTQSFAVMIPICRDERIQYILSLEHHEVVTSRDPFDPSGLVIPSVGEISGNLRRRTPNTVAVQYVNQSLHLPDL